MAYSPMKLKNELTIKDLITVHYFEFSKDYTFCGEAHNFWEFVYVDSGRIIVYFDDKQTILKSGDMIFHKPNEWHNLTSDGENTSNIVVVSFISSSSGMDFFSNKILKAGSRQRELISRIIYEGTILFKTPLNNPYTEHYEKNSDAPFGTQQLLKQHTEELLISIIQDDIKSIKTHFTKNNYTNLVNRVTEYLSENISKKVTISELCAFTNSSKSSIEKAFFETYGSGVLDCFINMKIEYAKNYIRKDNYNMTQIAEMLGYDNVHYFSRQFKAVTNMSPTEYSKSIKSL